MYFKALEMLSPVRTSLAAEMAFKSNKLVLKWENKAYWLQTEEQVETWIKCYKPQKKSYTTIQARDL